MEASPLNDKNGSFGIPAPMRASIAQHQERLRNPEPQPAAPAEPVAAAPAEASAETAAKTEPSPSAQVAEYVADMRERVAKSGIEINDDDFMAYVINGSITKTMTAIPNFLDVEFKTLTSDEMSSVEDLLASSITDQTLSREASHKRTRILFAHSIQKMGRPGKMRPLPDEVGEKIKAIGRLALPVINALADQYNVLEFALIDRVKTADLKK